MLSERLLGLVTTLTSANSRAMLFLCVRSVTLITSTTLWSSLQICSITFSSPLVVSVMGLSGVGLRAEADAVYFKTFPAEDTDDAGEGVEIVTHQDREGVPGCNVCIYLYTHELFDSLSDSTISKRAAPAGTMG